MAAFPRLVSDISNTMAAMIRLVPGAVLLAAMGALVGVVAQDSTRQVSLVVTNGIVVTMDAA